MCLKYALAIQRVPSIGRACARVTCRIHTEDTRLASSHMQCTPRTGPYTTLTPILCATWTDAFMQWATTLYCWVIPDNGSQCIVSAMEIDHIAFPHGRQVPSVSLVSGVAGRALVNRRREPGLGLRPRVVVSGATCYAWCDFRSLLLLHMQKRSSICHRVNVLPVLHPSTVTDK
ncbi:hypothetical protein CBL_07293 [Carabus blaptoides fortunei]